jgi:hypothetical protein
MNENETIRATGETLRKVFTDVEWSRLGRHGVNLYDVVVKNGEIAVFPVSKDMMPTMTMMESGSPMEFDDANDTSSVETNSYADDQEDAAEGEMDDQEPTNRGDLTERQLATMACYESIEIEYGEWSQIESHYMPNSPFDNGLCCANCVAFEGGRRCEWVEGDIAPCGICKLHVIPYTLVSAPMAKNVKVESEDLFSVVKSVEEDRFTLAPWYVPDQVDAHGEWTDGKELQKALWNYVRTADRDIRLQHDTSVTAGEWVEAVTWPFPIEVPMQKASGKTSTVEFPAETVFLGVQWEPWAWELVKSGKINGYSVGGKSKRLLVDFKN